MKRRRDRSRAARKSGKSVAREYYEAILVAFILVQMLKRYWVPDFLQNVVFLAAVVTAFTVSNHYLRAESGLVTVTILGIILANQKAVTVKHVVEFKENLRVLLISVLFIVLASRLQLEEITRLGVWGFAFLSALLVVVRLHKAHIQIEYLE